MKANGRTPYQGVSKPTPLTNSIKEILKEYAQDVLMTANPDPITKSRTQSIITKVKESLPEKKQPTTFDGEEPATCLCDTGWNNAIKDMEERLSL